MSDVKTLQKGQSYGFVTRAAGSNTKLYFTGGKGDESSATWHIELCCSSDHEVKMKSEEPISVDVSYAAGAIITVRNTGFVDFDVWTDA